MRCKIPDDGSIKGIGEDAFFDCEKLTRAVFERRDGWSSEDAPIDPETFSDPESAAELLTEGAELCREMTEDEE